MMELVLLALIVLLDARHVMELKNVKFAKLENTYTLIL